MKKFKKVMIAGLAAVMAVGVMSGFAACGGKKTELIVNTMFGGGDPHETAFRLMNNVFKDANPDIKLVDRSGNPTGDSQWRPNLIASMNSKNNVPDVIYFWSGSAIADFKDKVVKISDIRAIDKTYGDNITIHDTDEASLELKGTAQGLMYNTDMTADVEDYSALSAFFASKKNSAESLNVRPDVPHYWFNYLMCRELGIEKFGEYDGTKAFFTEAKAAEWKTAFHNTVVEMRKIGFGGTTNGANKAAGNEASFFEGTGGSALLDGSWQGNNLTNAKKEAKVAALPAKDTDKVTLKVDGTDTEVQAKVTMGGMTQGWYITTKAWANDEKRQLAIDYIKLHTSNYSIETYCKIAGGLAANGTSVPGSNKGSIMFVDMVNEADVKTITPFDDRTKDTSKATLLTDWTLNHPFAAMLIAAAEPTAAATGAHFQSFIDSL